MLDIARINAKAMRRGLLLGALILSWVVAAPVAAHMPQAITSSQPIDVVFGENFDQGACDVVNPLPPPPVYPPGTRLIAFQADFVVTEFPIGSTFSADLQGPFGGDRTGFFCFHFEIIKGTPTQSTLGVTVERIDGKPFGSGTYILKILKHPPRGGLQVFETTFDIS